MDVRNCRKCGRLFNYLSGPQLCEACKADLEKTFQRVKDYIRENPKASLNQIADDNGTTVRQLKQWVREERLEFAKDSGITLECENCGAPIRTGRYCEKCKNTLVNSLGSMYKKPEPEKPKKPARESDKMRFIK